MLGVRRGADLISYIAILGTLAGFFLMSHRIRQLNRHVTVLVRQTALANPKRGLEFLVEEDEDGQQGELLP